jgi:protein-L-isoaspartate(D-aspartate) O-methyltransferase
MLAARLLTAVTQDPPDRFAAARALMVQEQLWARGVRDQRLLEAMRKVPRHEFVDEEHRTQAYADHPIPIGEGQTISQPYIVAVTLEALVLDPSFTVLEIGTGSGYQTAILAELSRHVYSIERHASLARGAEVKLARLGYQNVTIAVGDGSEGLAAYAPYDVIAVSAAAPTLPPALLQQLRQGGRMVIPVGPPEAQKLELVQKTSEGSAIFHLEGCRFVPLIGSQGYAPK